MADRKTLTFTGRVFPGVGEGAYFIGLYRERLAEHCAYAPFPGTLNLHADPSEAEAFLSSLPSERISGFTRGGRTFGAVTCYAAFDPRHGPVTIVVPEKTRYDCSVLEVVAPTNLRETFSLSDGDAFTLSSR